MPLSIQNDRLHALQFLNLALPLQMVLTSRFSSGLEALNKCLLSHHDLGQSSHSRIPLGIGPIPLSATAEQPAGKQLIKN